jgi:hypothetical protein
VIDANETENDVTENPNTQEPEEGGPDQPEPGTAGTEIAEEGSEVQPPPPPGDSARSVEDSREPKESVEGEG